MLKYIGILPICYGGYQTYKTSTEFSFGCGLVEFTNQEVADYLQVMEEMLGGEHSEKLQNYIRVRTIVNEQGYEDCPETLAELRELFQIPSNASKTVKKPAKKAAKKPAAKKSAPKKAVKSKKPVKKVAARKK